MSSDLGYCPPNLPTCHITNIYSILPQVSSWTSQFAHPHSIPFHYFLHSSLQGFNNGSVGMLLVSRFQTPVPMIINASYVIYRNEISKLAWWGRASGRGVLHHNLYLEEAAHVHEAWALAQMHPALLVISAALSHVKFHQTHGTQYCMLSVA
ncbi:hypothetical protein BDR06DRAFT_968013 [Suillus hirtellus]|nr:hypothetical protein BDR06DRAFT_968013 [Suillus hirtellus]